MNLFFYFINIGGVTDLGNWIKKPGSSTGRSFLLIDPPKVDILIFITILENDLCS